ncbi:MAG TPA: 50S ribosomal protein L29 [Gemmatimonadales bacterium]|nr:50S ribosomal protein L29 [Gemmatimonadales bacterium]
MLTTSELKELSVDELQDRLLALRAEQFNLRFRSATEAIDNPMQFRTLRRDIARVMTAIRTRDGAAGGMKA